MSSDARIAFCDFFRGWASVLVVISHLFGVFWVGQKGLGNLLGYPPLADIVLPNADFIIKYKLIFGQLGVALFFIVSGFVISFSLQKYNKIGFLANRFFRIYPVYVVGFLVTVCGLYFVDFDNNGIPYTLEHLIVHSLIVVRQWADFKIIDGVSWTLEVEIYFYILMYLLFKIDSIRRTRAIVIVFLLAGPVAILISQNDWWLSRQVMALGYMMIGYFFFLRIKGLLSLAFLAIFIVYEFVVLFYLFSTTTPFKFDYMHWFIGYALAPVAFLFFMHFRKHYQIDGVSKFLSKISYPLYVVHAIFGYSLLVVFLKEGLSSWVSVTLTTIIVFLIAYVVHLLVEVPFTKLSRSYNH